MGRASRALRDPRARRAGDCSLPAWLAGLALSCLFAVSPAEATLPPPVSWSAAQQHASGLRIVQLQPGVYRRTQDALAEVLDSGALLRVQAELDAARALRSQARADLELARVHARQEAALLPAAQDVARSGLERARTAQDKAQAALLAADSAVRAARAACSMRLAAVAEAGRPLQAVWVPASAVLFHGGRAFVFVASKPAPGGDRQFAARTVSTAWPLGDGYVQQGWKALDVVVGGAGLLLTPPPEAHTLPPAGATDERDVG